jgi:glycosyltransferase involved in cell wall biosynthesis
VKFALVTTNVGLPGTLASTAFIGAFADGLGRIGVPSRVFALALTAENVRPETLAPTEVSTPWVDPPAPTRKDSTAAMIDSIVDEPDSYGPGYDWRYPDWYLELLLQRALVEYAAGDELNVLFYVRNLPLLEFVQRVCERCGFRLLVQSCEALSDVQIDPTTRDDFIELVVHKTDGTWALSNYLGDYWQAHGVRADRILVHPNVVRETSFRDDPPPRTLTAVYLGNLSHQEIDYLLAVSSKVREELPDFQLSIYGDASQQIRESLIGKIAERGLADTVRLHEAVMPQQVPDVLAGADALVLPRSKGEFSTAGFPNKLGEYLASGRPVVVTKVGDVPRYLEDQVSAFLIEPDDCEAFARALIAALTDRELADRVGAGGQAVAHNLLASGTVAESIAAFAASLPRPPRQSVRLVHRLALWWHAAARAMRGFVSDWWARTWRWLGYTKSSHTRWVALKMWAVASLQRIGLRKPPG